MEEAESEVRVKIGPEGRRDRGSKTMQDTKLRIRNDED